MLKDIKTKPAIKDIKVLDKATDVSRRAKNAYIRTKEQAERLGHNEDGNETTETITTTETILHINITSRSHTDIIAEYGFNPDQVKMLNELMKDEYQQLFMRLIGS